MIGELPLRCVVTVLFGASIAMYAYHIVAQRVRWSYRINHLLHLVMSIGMVSMVWRVGLGLPAMGPMLFFLLAGVWFAGAAMGKSSASRQRLKTWYYAAMMAAMAWMYAVMSGGVPGTHSHVHSPSDSAAMAMPGMGLPSHRMSPMTTGISWIAVANWVGAASFAAVALYWSYRFVGERRVTRPPTATGLVRLEPVYQAFTAAGTALMFDALVW